MRISVIQVRDLKLNANILWENMIAPPSMLHVKTKLAFHVLFNNTLLPWRLKLQRDEIGQGPSNAHQTIVRLILTRNHCRRLGIIKISMVWCCIPGKQLRCDTGIVPSFVYE